MDGGGKKGSGQQTRQKHAQMHTREGGGINSQKVTDLTNNWTFQSPLVSGSFGEGNEDIEMMGLEETTVVSGTWYFSNFFFIVFHHFSMLLYPFPLLSLSFTLQRKDNTRAIDPMT